MEILYNYYGLSKIHSISNKGPSNFHSMDFNFFSGAVRIEPTISEVKGGCSDDRAIEAFSFTQKICLLKKC